MHMRSARTRRSKRRLVGVMVAFCGASLAVACSTAGNPSAPAAALAVDAAATRGIDSGAPDPNTDADVADGTQALADASVAEAEADAAPMLRRVSGHVEHGGAVVGASVSLLSPTPMTTTTDQNGDFFFYAPQGSSAIVKVVAPNSFPMIRGVVVNDPSRIRVFYLAGPAEEAAANALGFTLDSTKGIVEVDFRNASVGGYGVTMKDANGNVIAPAFGVALDADGNPQSSMVTVAGGGGSTLLLGNVPPSTVGFTPHLPDGGVLPCTPCDAPSLPIEPGVVTWFDLECGTATDCK